MPLGTRPKGRPKTRWKDQVHTDMKELKIQYTPDRAEWKKQLIGPRTSGVCRTIEEEEDIGHAVTYT